MAQKVAQSQPLRAKDEVDVVVQAREKWTKKGRPVVDVVGRQTSGLLVDPLPEGIEAGQRLKATVVVASVSKGQSTFRVKEP